MELQEKDFKHVLPLLNNRDVEATAVCKRMNAGRVFADSVMFPTVAMVWLGNNDGLHVAGKADDEAFCMSLLSFVEQSLEPQLVERGLKEINLVARHPAWYPLLEKGFHHRTFYRQEQIMYLLHKGKAAVSLPLSSGYRIEKITHDFYENSTCINLSYLHRKLDESWMTAEEFFTGGRGYCVTFANEIVGLCHTAFAAENKEMVAIETSEAHQNQGIAKVLAQAFIDDCLRHHKMPCWDAAKENKASQKVAEQLGFSPAFSYQEYVMPIGT